MQGFSEYLRAYPGTDFSDNAQYWIGECLYGKKMYAESIEAWNTLLKDFPTSDKLPDARVKKGMALERLGRRSQALVEYRYVVDRYPTLPGGAHRARTPEPLTEARGADGIRQQGDPDRQRRDATPRSATCSRGEPIANFTLATNEVWNDKSGQKQERTEWHRVEVFGKTAQVVRDYVTKGKSVYIEGSIRYDEWTDKDGNKRNTTKIRVSGFGSRLVLLGSRGEGGGGGRAGGGGGAGVRARAAARRATSSRPPTTTSPSSA